MLAANRNPNPEIVRFLIEKGASLDALNDPVNTALLNGH
jgi:ankyrin repeat protein